MRPNSSSGRTDWVETKKTAHECVGMSIRSGDTFVTSTSLHHECDLILSHLRTCRLTIVTAPLAEITRVTRTLMVAAYIFNISYEKDATPRLFSDSSQSPNRSRRMHCFSLAPFNTLTHCSDCAVGERVEWCYTGKWQGMWSQGFWQTVFTVHSAHLHLLGNQTETNEAARWIIPIHLGKCLCALCCPSCDHYKSI